MDAKAQPKAQRKPKTKVEGRTGKHEIRVMKFSAVAQWKWKSLRGSDVCAICRSSTSEPSIMYQADSDAQGANKGLYVSIGGCGHAFHQDCIEKWSVKNGNCPLCAKQWVVNKILSQTGAAMKPV